MHSEFPSTSLEVQRLFVAMHLGSSKNNDCLLDRDFNLVLQNLYRQAERLKHTLSQASLSLWQNYTSKDVRKINVHKATFLFP